MLKVQKIISLLFFVIVFFNYNISFSSEKYNNLEQKLKNKITQNILESTPTEQRKNIVPILNQITVKCESLSFNNDILACQLIDPNKSVADVLFINSDGTYLYPDIILFNQQISYKDYYITKQNKIILNDEILNQISIPLTETNKNNPTIYIFTDFDCPYCKMLHEDLKNYYNKYNIYLVMFPLTTIHPTAELKAKIFLNNINKINIETLADILYNTSPDNLNDKGRIIKEIKEEAKKQAVTINIEELNKEQIKTILKQTNELISKLKINSTPTILYKTKNNTYLKLSNPNIKLIDLLKNKLN